MLKAVCIAENGISQGYLSVILRGLTGCPGAHVAKTQNFHGNFTFPASGIYIGISGEEFGMLFLKSDRARHSLTFARESTAVRISKMCAAD